MNGRISLFLALMLMGAGWGLTQPLAKIAVDGGYRHFGMIFWQLVLSGAVLCGVHLLRGGRTVQLRPRHLRVYLVIALVGTVLPNVASYEAARHLPAGIMSIAIATVPMFAFPIALLLGNEKFAWPRLFGLLTGFAGVLLLVGPEASLPERAMAWFIPLALIAPAFYGFEGNYVARWGTEDLDPVEVLLGASVIGACIALPMAFLTGEWIDPRLPWGARDWALIGSSVIHAGVYTSYVWMVGRAGPVYTAGVSYFVTGFGVIWSIFLLGESYSGWVWSAMAAMLLGMFLVRPRER